LCRHHRMACRQAVHHSETTQQRSMRTDTKSFLHFIGYVQLFTKWWQSPTVHFLLPTNILHVVSVLLRK
jgi:hypothetical protein